MSSTVALAAAEPSPAERLHEMAQQMYLTKATGMIAVLGIPDLLADGERSCEELASATGTHLPSLYRVLRSLTGVGVVREGIGRRFGLGPLGEALRTGVPGSMRDLFRAIDRLFIPAFSQAERVLQDGKPAFPGVFGAPFFDYLAAHPEANAAFAGSMTDLRSHVAGAVADAFDFGVSGTIVDVGGGEGKLLASILGRYPDLRGVLLDVPDVATRARALFDEVGLGDRVNVVGGDFFQRVPPAGDIYLLSWIIHDWPEPEALSILRNCREAMRSDARLLLVEAVMPPANEPHYSRVLDLIMLVALGGQERTQAEYQELLARAGLELARTIATESPMSILEAAVRE